MPPEDKRPDMVAVLDQMITGLENISKLMASYYKSLIDGGIPEALARELVIEYQKSLLSPFSRGNG